MSQGNQLRAFSDLLSAFQVGQAQYGGGGFELIGVPEQRRGGYFVSPAYGFVDSVFLPPDDADPERCYFVFGNYRGENWAESKDAFELFTDLARRAGASLPLRLQEQLGARRDPAGAWLACMYRFCPPIRNPLMPDRITWTQPFRDAADTIERAGLHMAAEPWRTPQPGMAINMPLASAISAVELWLINHGDALSQGRHEERHAAHAEMKRRFETVQQLWEDRKAQAHPYAVFGPDYLGSLDRKLKDWLTEVCEAERNWSG
ncbi:MAG: hypothetical protein O7H39_05415 [Gammaproteobacteria bacterium]|nr:hypothetical protein [Gammaproteobacteria bacterium]